MKIPKFKSTFQKVMWLGSIISFLLWVGFLGLDKGLTADLAPFSITFMTIFYHLAVRLVFGEWILMRIIPANPNYKSKYFDSDNKFERRLYDLLKLKKAVSNVPTYSPDEFSKEKHTWGEIASATLRSEIVHTVNVVLSFVTLLFTLKFGSFFVFLITSLLSAGFDLYFVMLQRYNRPRLKRIAERFEK